MCADAPDTVVAHSTGYASALGAGDAQLWPRTAPAPGVYIMGHICLGLASLASGHAPMGIRAKPWLLSTPSVS